MPSKRKGKWMPFDALEGYRESLREVEEEIEKEKMPELSNEKIIEINDLINIAFETKTKVKVKLIILGKRFLKTGYIKKINFSAKSILLNEDNFKIENIIDIILLDFD